MKLTTLMLAASLAATAFSASAAWPERPITLVVPWAAGGGTDAVARILAAGLEKELGKKFGDAKDPLLVSVRSGGNCDGSPSTTSCEIGSGSSKSLS